MNNDRALCPICKNKLTEHSELQDKICNMIIIKQFANNCPGFDVQFRPFFGKEEEGDQILLIKRDVRFNMKSQSTTQNIYFLIIFVNSVFVFVYSPPTKTFAEESKSKSLIRIDNVSVARILAAENNIT
ncbi:MAG: hypothetical protein ACJ72V_00605 [Nitrososphaeraceae archaeon]